MQTIIINRFPFNKKVLSAVIFLFAAAINSCFAKDISVCSSCKYNTLQSAINAASPGDNIIVKSGTYPEHKIIINKPVSIAGENYPVIDGEQKDECLVINSNNVKVSGLRIINSARGSMNDYAGIHIIRSNNIIVSDNILQNTFFGILVSASKNCLITNNKVWGEGTEQSSAGNGIQLWQCKNITITNNHIKKHRDGIYFEFARFCHIEHNLSELNFRYGLHFMFSDNDLYYQNVFRNNGTGAAVMYSHHISMFYNYFDNNWGDASYALLLKDISDGIIVGNHFTKNTVGILLDGSNRIKVSRNLFESNGWAVKLLANCMNDTFYKNNFSANTFDVSTNGTLYYSYFKNNYWDKYEGYDLNKDHLGDVPYRPVSLYSIIVEQIPQALMLLRSFTVDLMDKAEKIIPSLIPDLLIDEQPVMQKNKI